MKTHQLVRPGQVLADQLEALIAVLPHQVPETIDWELFHLALGALPLATEDYSVCYNELCSARKYLEGDEPGAARYELRLLLGHLYALEHASRRRPKVHGTT
jgi:hypothetical protein